MLVAETLAGMPAVFVGRHAKTPGRVEALEGRELRLSLADIPAPATEVRIALQCDERPLGTVQLQGRILSAYRADGEINVVIQIHRLFAPTDEDFLVTFLHRFLPDERVLGRQFRTTAAGTVYELPPPGSVQPLPPHIRDTLASHHGYIDHSHDAGTDASHAHAASQHSSDADAAGAPLAPPPESRGVSRQVLDDTYPVRIPLLAQLDGIPFLGVVYRVTDNGLRCFVGSLGKAPGFGARVALDVEVPLPTEMLRFRLVGAVAWTLGPDDSTPTTAFALRLGPGTTREAMSHWADLVHDEIRRWRDSAPSEEPEEGIPGLPPDDVVAALVAELDPPSA
ncbi:MAG: hypothetical protein R3F39_21045 [Myxococcota bacterium]